MCIYFLYPTNKYINIYIYVVEEVLSFGSTSVVNDSRCGLNFKTDELVKNPVATLVDTLNPTSSSCGPMSYVSLSFPLWGAVTQSILRPGSPSPGERSRALGGSGDRREQELV